MHCKILGKIVESCGDVYMKEKLKNLFKTQLYRMIYKGKPDKNTWVFSSTDNEKFNYNSKYLFEYVLKYEKNIMPYFVINNDILRQKLQLKYGQEYFISTNDTEGIKKVLSAGVWFTSAGLPLYGAKLNKHRLIVNLWHGVPLKKIALKENNYSSLKKLYFKLIFSDNYSYMLTTSKSLINIMKDSFGVNEDIIKVWGQPRNDILFDEGNKTILNDLFVDLPEYEKIVLYAPTYRDNIETKLFPFIDYSKEDLEEFLEKEKSVIFIRTHISENSDISKYLGKRVRLLNDDILDDIMIVLNLFDVLITDYSSIYIDYLLLNRPVIFLPYDKEEYLDNRGMNFEYDKVTPGPKPEQMQDLLSILSMNFKGQDEYLENRKLINEVFNEINSACCSEICLNINKILK